MTNNSSLFIESNGNQAESHEKQEKSIEKRQNAFDQCVLTHWSKLIEEINKKIESKG
jgi:hypothetical protein